MWLQASAQRAAVGDLGPAQAAARAPIASAPSRSMAPETVPPANLPFALAPDSSIRKSVVLPLAREAREPSKCPLCAEKLYTSGAIVEHLAGQAVHFAGPAGTGRQPRTSFKGKARRSLWHAPYRKQDLPPLAPSEAGAPGRGEAEAAAPAPQSGHHLLTQDEGAVTRQALGQSQRGAPLPCCGPS